LLLAFGGGGNSNWRGPIWMPVNGLIIPALPWARQSRCDHGSRAGAAWPEHTHLRDPAALGPWRRGLPRRRGDRGAV